MSTLLIAIHVIAAVALIGPVMVSTSMFAPRIPEAKSGNASALGALKTLGSMTNNYGMFSALVPILGIAVFLSDMDLYGKQGQFHAAIALAVIAWALLLFLVVPKQKAVIAAAESNDASFDFDKSRSQLAMFGGIFNLLWIICAILMFI